MLLSMIAAATLQAAQPAPARVEPREAIYVLHGDYGPPRAGNIRRLLDQWAAESAIRRSRRAAPRADIAACLPSAREVDWECLRGLYPSRPGEPPVVLIVARDSGRRNPVLSISCVGPDGSNGTTAGMNRGGAFSSLPRERSEIRVNIARCIQASVRGAITTSAAPMRGFDWGSLGDGDFFYHRVTGDCADLLHRIGRNATRGAFSMPLQGVRWSLEQRPGATARVRLACADGACIRWTVHNRERMVAEHHIPFPDLQGAAGYIRALDSLKRVCPA